jgi:hypothetical protein
MRALILVGLVLSVAIADAAERVDLYDKNSKRTGYATVDKKSGRIDLYDKDSRRTGYGRIDQRSGRIDLYDPQSRRTGTGRLR